MRKKLSKISLSYLILFLATSCITINIYFPAAAVEKAADKIVEEVWGDESTAPPVPDSQEQKGEPRSMLEESLRIALSLIGPDEAFAQEADIEVTTPAIRALKESIQQRAEDIKPYMDRGNAGITNDGLLAARTSEGLNLREKAQLVRLIDAENKDRNALYVEIAKANNFPSEKVQDIKVIFAGSWVRKARNGWWYQDSGGSWIQK